MIVEMIDTKRKRLIFRSWHRGTKEMDQIMGSFANFYVPDFTEEELELYDNLLQNSDPDLYDWICGLARPPVDKQSHILDKLLNYDYASQRSTGSDEFIRNKNGL